MKPRRLEFESSDPALIHPNLHFTSSPNLQTFSSFYQYPSPHYPPSPVPSPLFPSHPSNPQQIPVNNLPYGHDQYVVHSSSPFPYHPHGISRLMSPPVHHGTFRSSSVDFHAELRPAMTPPIPHHAPSPPSPPSSILAPAPVKASPNRPRSQSEIPKGVAESTPTKPVPTSDDDQARWAHWASSVTYNSPHPSLIPVPDFGDE